MKRYGAYLRMFALLFFCMAHPHQIRFDGPTPVSRLDLLHSLFIHSTFRIDAYHQNTSDKAIFKGNYYSDKAPGTVALALVPFTVAAGALWLAGASPDSDVGWLSSSWLACAGSIGIITALGGVALFAWLSRYVAPKWSLITTLALFLGAAPLPYATMMFSHALVVGLLAIAIWAIGKQRSEVSNQQLHSRGWAWVRRNRWGVLAGHACGWALASEYSSGLIVGGLFIWLVFMSRAPLPTNSQVGRATQCAPGPDNDNDGVQGTAHPAFAVGAQGVMRPKIVARLRTAWMQAMPFCLAAIPPLLLIPAYSWACFGNPFVLPYSFQASFPAMQEGVYAIKSPNPETAFNLLFTPARGLLFWTPFFVMAFFGYWQMIQKSRGLFWLTYLVPLLHIVVISGRTWDWPAGPAWGPRLLSPMIPLLALPCAYGIQRWPKLGIPLAVYSILVTTLATLTDACPSYPNHPNPLFDLNIPLFLKGEFSPNLGMVLGLPPYASVALYYVILIGGVWWLWRQFSASDRPNIINATGARQVASSSTTVTGATTGTTARRLQRDANSR